MQTANLEEARHGWNVVYDGFSYPFKTYNAASKLLNALYLLTSQDMLTQFKRFRVNADRPVKTWSTDYFKENEEKVEGVIAQARIKRDAKARSLFPMFFIDYETSPLRMLRYMGSPTGRTCAGASLLANRYTISNETAAQVPDRVDSVLKEKWPSFGHPFKAFDYAEQEKRILAQQAPPAVKTAEPVGAASPAPVTNACSEVVVESIDPRKIPLLHYVNAELLPDAPKDDDDVSTEACYKRQARTIHGLLSDLRQRTEDLTQERTSHEITKSKLKAEHDEVLRLDQKVGVQATNLRETRDYNQLLRDERDAYKSQVLKNTESIAVVKYSHRDHEWHLVQNGIAYRYFLRSDYLQALLTLANAINLGRVPVNTPALIRKPYYYKEDYA